MMPKRVYFPMSEGILVLPNPYTNKDASHDEELYQNYTMAMVTGYIHDR